MRHSTLVQVDLDLQPEVLHVGSVGKWVGLLAYKRSDNVASASESVDAPRCATEICHLICEQIRIGVLGVGATVAHASVCAGGTSGNPNLFRMARQPTVH